jgi:hypothetical protein
VDNSESRSDIPGKVLKCGAGEEWRRPAGPIVCDIKKYYIEERRRGISYVE